MTQTHTRKRDRKSDTADRRQIEYLPTSDLIPYARNARIHSEAQVSQIAGSIREFGFTNPVLIDGDNGIIAGHGRVLAAQTLGLSTVPCLRLGHLTEAQKRAYILADNRLAQNAGWDEAMLANELSDLHADDFELGLLGFDIAELENLLRMPVLDETQAPDDFKEVDDRIETEHTCPKCGYQWSGGT